MLDARKVKAEKPRNIKRRNQKAIVALLQKNAEMTIPEGDCGQAGTEPDVGDSDCKRTVQRKGAEKSGNQRFYDGRWEASQSLFHECLLSLHNYCNHWERFYQL